MSQDLVSLKCQPCRGGTPPLKGSLLAGYAGRVGGGWAVVEEHHLVKEFKFRDFREALAFVNRVGEIAEAEGHHPEIWFTWGKVRLTLWTHKVDGLTESDFILAAKIDGGGLAAPRAADGEAAVSRWHDETRS
jgi:4a-hydroxytetrahydrobiopterin dehydratase